MEVEAEVKKATSFSIETYGVSLCSDGWDNVVHRLLMNIMLSCPAGDIFLGSVDTSGNKKTKEYIVGELKRFIEQIGPMKVSQICTDNAANMLGAVGKVIETYPHIYKQGCAAHALDLLLEDWAKIQGPHCKSKTSVLICEKPSCHLGTFQRIFAEQDVIDACKYTVFLQLHHDYANG